MTHPFRSELLASFPEQLEQSGREDWDAVVGRLVLCLCGELNRGHESELSDNDKQWLERLIQALEHGPQKRKSGRPNTKKQSEGDREMFSALELKTPGEAAKLLLMLGSASENPLISNFMFRRTEPAKPKIDVTTDDARRRKYGVALKRAQRSGYIFPEKGVPYGKRRKIP